MVEVKNKFKGLYLIGCPKNYGQRFVTLYRRQQSKPRPRKTNAKRQNGCLRRLYFWQKNRRKRQRRKGKIYPSECRVPKNSKERWENLPQWLMQEIEENNRRGKTRDLFKKIGDVKGIFHAKMDIIKDRIDIDLYKQKRSRRCSKNTQKNYMRQILMTQITTMVWSLT